MNIVKAKNEHLDAAFNIVSRTIKETYKKCYCDEIIDFFLMIHSKENIERDINDGTMFLIEEGGQLVGAGGIKENHIFRVYILPEFEGRGFGRSMMDFLEEKASINYSTASLDPSDIAADFYKKRGYEYTIRRECNLPKGAFLRHDTMEKILK